MRTSFLLFLVFSFLFVPQNAKAEIPQIISYQGKVTDSGGTPVTDGTYTMRFRIYDAATGGTLEWDSGNRLIAVSGGVFNILLGETPQPSIDLEFDEDYWLLITFADISQSPRQRLSASGYAFMASGLVPGTTVEGAVVSAIRGISTVTSGAAQGGYFECDASSGRGVYARTTHATGTTYGGRFVAISSAGRGVRGEATAGTGTTYGGYFNSSSSSGRGVYGAATATSGITYGGWFKSSAPSGNGVYAEAPLFGVQGKATATSGVNYGGYFETASTEGTGVRGIATATEGVTFGVLGRSYSTADDSRGVYGRSYATTGSTYGVYGRSDSENGIGVFGVAGTTEGISYGVYGIGNVVNGCGVYGEGNTGAKFVSIASGNVGVSGYGQAAGGYFEDPGSSGYAYVGRGTNKIYGNGTVDFVQNHPYNVSEVIVYAAPEGDEVATYTRGTARLIAGKATVQLGETFKWVTNPDIGLTAHLTPRGDCEGLYVESLTTDAMIVHELRGGSSDVVFDYIIYGLRIGFEEVSIVQEKEREAYIPSMINHRERYATHPGLRKYNAFERFKKMRTAIEIPSSLDLSSSHALRDAIEEYNPDIHGSVAVREREHLLEGAEDHRHKQIEPSEPAD